MALLETIYPGSSVWIHGTRAGKTTRIYAKVLRRTRKQFVIDDGFDSRFRRDNGMEIGGLHDRIEGIATVEEIAAFDLERATQDACERELREEERKLRVLLQGYGIELTRRHRHYEMRFVKVSASRVRALFSAFKGAR